LRGRWMRKLRAGGAGAAKHGFGDLTKPQNQS
jgi:hypothetical protein